MTRKHKPDGIEVLEYGTIFHGAIAYNGGSPMRYDTYIARDSGEEFHEPAFCFGENDDSPRAETYGTDHNVKYNGECSCCYLGLTHTVARHNHNIGAAQ